MRNRFVRWTGGHRVLTVLVVFALVGLAGAGFIAARPERAAAPPAPSPSPSASPASSGSPSASPSASPSESPAAAASACRADPLANVYHPERLRVVDECKTVTGVVRLVRHERDGDVHINIELDAAFALLANASNRAQQDGDLVVEIVPADAPGCVVNRPPIAPSGSYDYGLCTGSNVLTPPVGARVRVTGPYVIDTLHGWAEIHPVWELVLLDRPVSPPATSLRILSVSPDPLQPGKTATLSAQTSAGALCTVTVRYPSGTVSKAKGLVQKNAPSSGRVSWTWNVGPTTKPGIGSATVTCGGLTDQASFTVA